MGECLAVFIDSFNKTQVWVMKEYRVQSSWTLIEIPMPLSAVCMTKSGELIALSANVSELMKFNEKGELLERCEYSGAYVIGFHLPMYTGSLFSLPRNNDGSMETTSTETDKEK
ncbi:uncharacterized protein LOC133314240 [Gastrolobium bilobum]|uniref:uncharacterized protein LOC133314240 n=1 Tax=Gastrolobium bilobum TaxID=150636 RepID=UPI002AB2D218|nr:uncharacterized protein LOC133314240 [Gastrolobium bilobum]